MNNRRFGIDMTSHYRPLGFSYGDKAFGPRPEIRKLDAIRKSLMDPECDGPQDVYAIVMDVGNREDSEAIRQRNLLFGVVSYAGGRLGREPVRSQGHIHAVSPSCGSSTGELYEIWHGKAGIFMQERAEDDPGRCFLVIAEEGDVVLVPPNWAHATINMDVKRNMTFGAWCVRDYGFDYAGVRAHHGVAYFPVIRENGEIEMTANPHYQAPPCIIKKPRIYEEFNLEPGVPVYEQFRKDPDRFLFISRPGDYQEKWTGFEP
ncbi:MAG: glucose-6-phosphate isomerase [Erysipelotrichaceae bacterium]|nr:glucose-6-phosphate isomerase [Erysipelotrichaceae bacterium]